MYIVDLTSYNFFSFSGYLLTCSKSSIKMDMIVFVFFLYAKIRHTESAYDFSASGSVARDN